MNVVSCHSHDRTPPHGPLWPKPAGQYGCMCSRMSDPHSWLTVCGCTAHTHAIAQSVLLWPRKFIRLRSVWTMSQDSMVSMLHERGILYLCNSGQQGGVRISCMIVGLCGGYCPQACINGGSLVRVRGSQCTWNNAQPHCIQPPSTARSLPPPQLILALKLAPSDSIYCREQVRCTAPLYYLDQVWIQRYGSGIW